MFLVSKENGRILGVIAKKAGGAVYVTLMILSLQFVSFYISLYVCFYKPNHKCVAHMARRSPGCEQAVNRRGASDRMYLFNVRYE